MLTFHYLIILHPGLTSCYLPKAQNQQAHSPAQDSFPRRPPCKFSMECACQAARHAPHCSLKGSVSNFADHKTASGTCYGAPVPAWSSDSLGLGGTWESVSFNKHPG